jgi:hypothetical protein
MSLDFRRIASVAAMVGLAMGSSMGGAEVMPKRPPAGVTFGGRQYRSTRRPSGSKLWRKASEGKLGLRW